MVSGWNGKGYNPAVVVIDHHQQQTRAKGNVTHGNRSEYGADVVLRLRRAPPAAFSNHCSMA